MGIFSEQVKIRKMAEGLTTLVMPTGAKDVITISGSILGGSLHTTTKNHKRKPKYTKTINTQKHKTLKNPKP